MGTLSIAPFELATDRYWKGTLHIFINNPKLQGFFCTHINLATYEIDVHGLKRASRTWSRAEKFMLGLALNLYSERNKINLADMDYLDEINKQIAIEAIAMRFDANVHYIREGGGSGY